MKTNRSIELSQRVYARLFKLYPQEHRDEYGKEMLQVFTDQCRSAENERGTWGLFFLWLRSLSDLGVSCLREHMSSPNVASGLLEAIPGRPLPWKGVALVLIPGLVFLVSQIAQLNGQDWYFFVVLRGSYILILPVLLIWALTRKFPIWGLIPLGILYRTFWFFTFQHFLNGTFLLHLPSKGSKPSPSYLTVGWWINSVLVKTNSFLRNNDTKVDNVIVFTLLVILIVLTISAWRRGIFSKTAWIWLALCIGISLTSTLLESYQYLQNFAFFANTEDPNYFIQVATWRFKDLAEILIIILAGTLLLRRYGNLALLLPLGYMIPSILYGRVTSEDSVVPFFILGISVLAYRVILTLIAPVWILRSASEGGQKRAFGIALLTALLVSAALNTLFTAYYFNNAGTTDVSIFFFSIRDQLLSAAGIGLALTLYHFEITEQPKPSIKLNTAEIQA